MAIVDPTKPAIVIRLPNWIGDVCMCLPSLEALKQTGHPLVICGRPWAQELTRQFEPSQFVALNGKFLSDRRAIANIAKPVRQTGLGLIFPDSFSSAALFTINGLASAGYRDDGRSLLLRHALRKPDHPVHAVLKWWLLTQNALEQWQIKSPFLEHNPPAQVRLDLSEADRAAARAALQANDLTEQSFILLAPTATGLHHGKIKVWPHFANLAKQLIAAGHQVAMCPPIHERAQAQATCPTAKLLPPLALPTFCALTQMARIVVCNDSGVSHLAAVSGANQVTLFGVTDPRYTGPWSDRAQQLGQLGQWPSTEQVLQRVMQQVNNAPTIATVKPLTTKSI